MGERPPVLIGERVLWLGSGSGLPKGGKVKWIGRLPEMGPDWAVGLELDEALPYGGIDGTWRHRKLFMCQHKHGLIVPRSSVILQPQHMPGETLVTSDTSEDVKKRCKVEQRQHPPIKSISKVSKLIRALSSDDSSDCEFNEHIELPSTHLRNRNLERQLSILGTLRRTGTLDSGHLEGVKSEACLYSVILEKEENAYRRGRRMIDGREFKRSEGTLDRIDSINSSRSVNSKKDRSSGIFSFFRWFKKEKYDVDSEFDSPPSPNSPILRRTDYSITGSVDTLFSTATARSFAFVSPAQYKPFGSANPTELRISSEPETNTYKNRIRQRDILRRKERNITLREKYNLHSGETLPRNDVDQVEVNDRSIKRKRKAPPPPEVKTDSTSESSLPAVLLVHLNNSDRQHRRTQSEPSQSGNPKPCHKKGKRKAPLPPLIIPVPITSNTLSLQRKKRPAPPPPVQRSVSDEIDDILRRSDNGLMGSQNSLNRWETLSTASTVDIGRTDVISTDTLKLERGYLKSNKDDKPVEMKYASNSPVSPKPWYKRNSTTRDSFSRSNERKRDRDKRRVEDWMIESGIPRRPNLLSENKINVFSKMDKNDDKRRSQISILTNISELDREAAEIVQKNKEKEKALLESKDNKFYGPDNQTLNGYFNSKFDCRGNFSRDLITLFDSMAKATNSVLLNDSHVRQTDENQIRRIVLDEQEIKIVDVGKNLDINSEPGPSGQHKIARVTIEELDDFDKERNSKAQALYEANRLQRAKSPITPTIKEVTESVNASNEQPGTSQSKTSQSISLAPSSFKSTALVVWNCPRCTLENPRWKITCDACDMWRPVQCEFKEVNPKHPLPLAVLRIVEPKDEIPGGSKDVKIVETKIKNDVVKMEKTSNALTISDLLFNTQSNSKDNNFNIKNSYDNLVLKSPSEEKIINLQNKIKPSEFKSTKPTPSGSESSVSSLSSDNLEPFLNNRTDLSVKIEPEEIRKARLAFFDKLRSSPSNEDKINDLNKNNRTETESVQPEKSKTKDISETIQINDKFVFKPERTEENREGSVKNIQTSTDVPYKPTFSSNYYDDKIKLKEMLKEMKHSLPKRSKEINDSSKCVKNVSPNENLSRSDIEKTNRPKTTTETHYVHPSSDKAEMYLVESETIIEEIKVRKSPEKESSSSQTGAIVRQIVPVTKPPRGVEITVPITLEEYNIKDGVLYTSISKQNKKIGTGTFQLLRPRDFANIQQIKKKGGGGDESVPVYANVGSDYDILEAETSLEKQHSHDVEKLSFQLTQPQGLAHFRAGLANNHDSTNMNTFAVNRLLRRLENAIANGQHESAAAFAKELAQLKVNCIVTRQKPETLNSQILVEMYVEDKQNHQGPFPLYLKSSMTLEQLKNKVEKEYEIPRDVQRWIIGKALANENSATLESMGIVEDGSAIFLYLVVPEEQHFPVVESDEEEELEGAVGGVPFPKFNQKVILQTGNNVNEEMIKIDVREVKPSIPINNGSSIIQKENNTPLISKWVLEKPELGWECPRCTLVNDRAIQTCAACGSRSESTTETRPLNGGDNSTIEENKPLARAQVVEEKKLDYQQLVDLEKSDLIICKEAFECPVCFDNYNPNEGIVLRECLHVFCRGCLANTVEYSEEAEVKCPYRDETYTCDSTLLEREIKALVEPNVYEQHLAKSIALAETKIVNAFHCKTPDCKGWCIFEDNVNLFKCPVCTHSNCLTCQAVHEGLDCKQYQERINVESEVNVESRRTKEMLQEMVDRGEAMNCPTCQVVLMKKWGCDWLRCSMCKTEICWITRGPRWGPNGKGDTSGGCQCGVNGVKCHPKCTYCH